jgi:hypothetical protein
MPPKELVALAVERHHHFKEVVLELRSRPPDPDATAAVLAAWAAGAAPPWLTAVLLGAARDPAGYSAALQILRSAPGSLAESYAAAAMVHIRGEAARSDLIDILESDVRGRARKGAALGLVQVADANAAMAVLAARRRRQLGTSSAAAVLARVPEAEELIVGLLREAEPLAVQVALEAAMELTAAPGEPLLRAVRHALAAGLVSSKGLHRSLSDRFGDD